MRQETLFKQEMKRDLMRIYRQVTSEYDCKNQTEAYRRVVEHEAPRFYVDVKWAHQRLSPMMRGDRSRLEKIPPLSRQMYEDLFDVVMRLSQEQRFCGASLYKILRDAVMEPAKRFYISTDRMRQIWKEEVKKQRDKSSVNSKQ